MIDLGLTRDEYRAYMRTLRSDHQIDIQVAILDQNEEPLESFTAPINRVLDGAVQVDSTAEVPRALSLTLLDEKRELRFEFGSPARGALFADRFISVRYGVFVAELDRWVRVPVFWGPLTSFARDGGEVTIEAHGKERLLLAPHYATRGYTIPKGTRIDDAVKRVARRAGETRFNVPGIPRKLAAARSVSARTEPWHVIAGGGEDANGKKIPGLVERAEGDFMVFYDGRGRLTLRRAAGSGRLVLREGRDLLTPVQADYDVEEFRNTVIVSGGKAGGKPKGKQPAHGMATLEPQHPLSPVGMRRNDQERYMTEFVEGDFKTDKESQEHAKKVLERRARMGIAASFDCLPMPHLEEGDTVALDTDEWSMEFQARQFTIPLTSNQGMTIGRTKRVRRPKRRGLATYKSPRGSKRRYART